MKGTPNLVGQFGGGVTIYLQKSKPTKKSCDPKTGAPLSNEVSLVGGAEGFAHSSCQQEIPQLREQRPSCFAVI